MAQDRYEPSSRFWHSAASVEGLVYIRGGNTSDFNSSKQELASTLERFDPVHDAWQKLTTTGIPHPGLSAVACASSGGYLYMYGGFDGEELHSTLSQLDLRTLEWSQLSTEKTLDAPMRKDACGMVHFHRNRLAVIAGYAMPTGPIQPGSIFVPNELFADGTGWTNEFHVFDINGGSWSSPSIKGSRPPPCADFTFTTIDVHRAVLYGGCRPPEGMCLDKDLYIINFRTMEMAKIEWKMGELWPVVTIGHHAACCMGFNTDHPKLLVSGGRTSLDKCIRDIWMFDFTNEHWEKIELPVNTQPPRWGHTATTITLPNGTEEVILIGGCSDHYRYGWENLVSMSILRIVQLTTIFFGSMVQAVKTSGQLGLLRRNLDLAQFVIEGTFTGTQLGSGYFGSVEEVRVKGLLCAGKRIKQSVIATERNSGGWDVNKMYLKECRLMSAIRHPNITQFIGLFLHPTSPLPILVMEKLEGHLHDLLETCPKIPLVLKLSMLKDVAKALAYLHPQVIHRDMTAKNVLLTPFLVAKICDFGSCLSNDVNAKVLNPPGLTPYPGERVYMSPEALAQLPAYDSSLDIFSFGHLMLFMMTQIYPDHLEPASNSDDSTLITEVERRLKYFKLLEQEGDYHELIHLAKDCLNDSASSRPTAEEIVYALEQMNANGQGVCQLLDAIKKVAM